MVSGQAPVIARVVGRQAVWLVNFSCLGSRSILFPRGAVLNCPKCSSDDVVSIPAEVRLYRNPGRTMSHPPMTPAPEICVCLDCGWSEFSIPNVWLSAGWLHSLRKPRASTNVTPIRPIRVAS